MKGDKMKKIFRTIMFYLWLLFVYKTGINGGKEIT